MKVPKFTAPGSTHSRRRFWNQLSNAIESLTKVAGRNVTVQEFQSNGTIINVVDREASGVIPTATGACCIDGACSITTQADCISSGGHYNGDNTSCDVVDCTQGACCADDGTCTLSTAEECTGTFQGSGTVCDPNPCPGPPAGMGACCIGGECSVTTEVDCYASGGNYLGDGTTCGSVDCTHGACCIDGVCTITAPGDCAGTYQGDGSTCSPDPCTPCHGCGFFNSCNGLTYKTRIDTASGSVLQGDIGGDFVLWAFSSTRHLHCNDDGTITCTSSGSGTADSNTGEHSDFTPDCTTGTGITFFAIGGLFWSRISGPFSLPPDGCGEVDTCDSITYTDQMCFGRVFNGTNTIAYSEVCVPP